MRYTLVSSEQFCEYLQESAGEAVEPEEIGGLTDLEFGLVEIAAVAAIVSAAADLAKVIHDAYQLMLQRRKQSAEQINGRTGDAVTIVIQGASSQVTISVNPASTEKDILRQFEGLA